jgi:hypothetical protein
MPGLFRFRVDAASSRTKPLLGLFTARSDFNDCNALYGSGDGFEVSQEACLRVPIIPGMMAPGVFFLDPKQLSILSGMRGVM